MKTLEERIENLEAIEEIKKLRPLYCYLVDPYHLDDLSQLFTNDAVLDLRPFLPETINGKDNIIAYYRENKSVMSRHQSMNPIIEVEGTKAKGTWYLFGPLTAATREGDTALWVQGRYGEEYVKEGKSWRFAGI